MRERDGTSADLHTWRERLRSLAMQRLDGTPVAKPDEYSVEQRLAFIANFRDDIGNRRPVDGPLLARLMGVSISGEAASSRRDEVQLWRVLHVGGDPLTCVAPISEVPTPLFPDLHHLAIELWTESELSGLHALSHYAASGNSAAEVRVRSAALWLLENVQPDNATQRPWAVHVFLKMAGDLTLSEAVRGSTRMYAETLLHNAMVPMGPRVPDIFSACVLLDSAA